MPADIPLEGAGAVLSAIPTPFTQIAGAITSLLGALGVGGGCGSTCTQATTVVNQAAVQLQANLTAWNNSSKTTADQQQAIANFNSVWNIVVQQCQQIGGQGGKGCIADRQRGGKFDWFATFLDPIQNATPSDAGTISAVLTSDLGSNGLLYIGGAMLFLALFFNN